MQLDLRNFLEKRGLVDLPVARQQLSDAIGRLGVSSSITDAIRAVPRHGFIPSAYWRLGYVDAELWFEGAYLPAPASVALMSQALALSPDTKLLEIGTATGYGTAILARLAGNVFTMAMTRESEQAAAAAFEDLGISNIRQKLADDNRGWPEEAPFDAIVVNFALPDIAQELISQLNPHSGRLVAPIWNGSGAQRIILTEMNQGVPKISDLGSGVFPRSGHDWREAPFPIVNAARKQVPDQLEAAPYW